MASIFVEKMKSVLLSFVFSLEIYSSSYHYIFKVQVRVSTNDEYEQAGTGPSRRHIQGSKIAKRLPSVKYSFTVVENRKFFEKIFLKKLHTKKMDRVARRGANVSQCRKTERGDPLRFFNIHSVAKHEKIEEKIFLLFSEKDLTMPKKLKGGTLWDFPTSILSQNIKKMQGGPFEGKKFRKKIRKKCLAVPKKIERGTLWSRPVWYVTRKNR